MQCNWTRLGWDRRRVGLSNLDVSADWFGSISECISVNVKSCGQRAMELRHRGSGDERGHVGVLGCKYATMSLTVVSARGHAKVSVMAELPA